MRALPSRLLLTRIELPPPPRFDPVPLLDHATAEVYYTSPLQTMKTAVELTETPPTVHIRATQENKLALLRKLHLTGRLQPLHKSSVRAGYLSGLFAVPKSLTRDRLILDARPANLADRALGKWCRSMASAAVLADLFIEPEYVLAASGEDLRDFFYQFKVGKERVVRNALADPLSLKHAQFVFGDSLPHDWEPPVYCGLSTLAMGDLNACEFAQCSHLALMLRAGVLQADEMISLQGDVPRGLMSVGVIIDDLVLLEKMIRRDHLAVSQGRMRSQADSRLDKALAAYEQQRLEVNLKKEFRNQTTARFCGIELDGEKGMIRGSTLRLWPLIVVTARVAMLGLCSVTLLEAIAGSWVSLFAVRRRLLCSMNVIFEAIAMGLG